jgi:hypothetical protein
MKKKSQIVYFLIAFLFVVNFLTIFHSIAPKAHADYYLLDGAFTLVPPDPCLCPHQGYTCYCFYPGN